MGSPDSLVIRKTNIFGESLAGKAFSMPHAPCPMPGKARFSTTKSGEPSDVSGFFTRYLAFQKKERQQKPGLFLGLGKMRLAPRQTTERAGERDNQERLRAPNCFSIRLTILSLGKNRCKLTIT